MLPLLEREPALAALAADLDAARRGEGRTVLVSGEAGIGKTTLIERFVDELTTERVLWGACESLSTPQPLGPLNDLVRDSRGTLRTLLAEDRDRGSLFAAVLDELSIKPSPVVLVLEDIHWADAATLDLVKFIGRRIHRLPALMILTYRDDELNSSHLLRSILGHLPARHASRLAVPRLSPGAVSRLAADAERSDHGLHEATGGNAFFVTEILASAARGVPESVSDAVLGRMAPLSAEAREVLEFAAIVPRAIETALISRVLQPSAAAIDECIGIGLLSVEGRNLRFRHELARVAVEQAIPHAKAIALHARVLAALGEPGIGEASLARLVHHAQRAEDRDAILDLAPRAARDAAMRGARREAAAHCRIALAFADALPDAEHAALLEEYAGHCFELSDLGAAIPAREQAIALFEKIGDRARCSESLARQAMPLVRALRNADADASSRRAIEIAETLPEGPTLAMACATEAYLRMLNRDVRDAIAWGERAIALSERFDCNETRATAYNVLGAATVFVDYPRGCEHMLTSLRLSRQLASGDAGVGDSYMMLGTASG